MRHNASTRALLLLAAVAIAHPGSVARAPAAAAPDATALFLARHWSDPVAPQGKPPPAFSPLEASLDPAACGQCHAPQYRDWQSSLHARSMGPGILWQMHAIGPKAANSCMRCHAPLAEQKALLAIERGWQNAPAAPPPAYVAPDLHRRGLICAACHVRGHARFGPPPRDGAPRTGNKSMPHGGSTASAAFQDSRFCSECHQFPSDGPRLNGKLIENTFEEWRSSAAAAQGRSCQSCHMPDRRHLWRGIHDAAMTRQALEASLEVLGKRPAGLRVRARLANVGAGHHFPTYLVPEVVATLRLVDAAGAVRAELARHVIGRRADLELTREISDTRIAAGGHALLEAALPRPGAKGWSVELRVRVHPAAHYERLFRDWLERPRQLSPAGLALLREALAQAESAGYELLVLRRPVPAP